MFAKRSLNIRDQVAHRPPETDGDHAPRFQPALHRRPVDMPQRGQRVGVGVLREGEDLAVGVELLDHLR